MASAIIDASILTIFAREALEGTIIIGEFRTIVLCGKSLDDGVTKEQALRTITMSAIWASALALVVIACVAIPLVILSKDFDPSTSKVIEGVSKMVAGICLLQLSLKLPKWLGLYGNLHGTPADGDETIDQRTAEEEDRAKECNEHELDVEGNVPGADRNMEIAINEQGGESQSIQDSEAANDGDRKKDCLTLAAIRFNVAWNIWREVAECGVFLIPSFLTGEGLTAIPLSAFLGCILGGAMGLLVYFVNHRLKKRRWALGLFVVLLVSFFSAGLFTNGFHYIEQEFSPTKVVWSIENPFWDVQKLPMTVFKLFGYDSTRTVFEIVCFWSWLTLLAVLQYLKYRRYRVVPETEPAAEAATDKELPRRDTVEMGGSSGSDSARDKMSEGSEHSLEQETGMLGSAHP